ncbi:MAG: hypothetical protein L0271_08110 [Gemmatimonadetes bacterium]|nr:hypothetical protein [Gemmatimonadota bacterium]
MTYLLRPEDRTLIDAALRLGDWIRTQPGLNREQREAVDDLQAALRAMPDPPACLIAEYGFEARFGPEEANGLYRAWRVGISPAGLEIFSVYSPDLKIDIEEKLTHELNFWLRPGRLSTHDGYNVAVWIREVEDPGQIRAGATLFDVIAESQTG